MRNGLMHPIVIYVSGFALEKVGNINISCLGYATNYPLMYYHIHHFIFICGNFYPSAEKRWSKQQIFSYLCFRYNHNFFVFLTS